MTADRVYQVPIAATPEATWAALTEPGQVCQYYFDTAVRTTWAVGSPIEYVGDDGEVAITGVVTSFDPPRSFGHTFIATWSPAPTTATFVFSCGRQPRCSVSGADISHYRNLRIICRRDHRIAVD
jgi:uncharacterized protein YndB with AHSA1/START domain